MFPRRKRLPRAQFPAALKSGRRFSSANFRVVVPHGASGYAVIIPKKIVRSSVKRHLLKRRIMAAIQDSKLPPALIVFPQASASGVHYQDMKSELARLLSTIPD